MLPLLLYLMVCSGIVLCYMRSVYQEAEVAREFLCRKQLETIAQSFMFTALQQEKETEITNAVYTLNPLQPGNDEVKVSVSVNRVKDLGMRFLRVDVSDSCSNEFSLRQCSLLFPDHLLQHFEHSPIIVTGSVAHEESGEKKITITSTSDGAVFPHFSVEEIAIWASTDFPSALELQRDGLSGWIYLCKKELSLPKGLNVNGDGILAFADDVTISDSTVFTGHIIILADRNVRIGNHVKLEKALLLCRGKLTVGTDSIINGAVMAQQDAVVDDTSTITGDREVLEPFHTIISY
ncbi:MAG: hypothetical protein IKZ43_00655 [Acidaminococcaceae bacterium]|nr:hypothetical protein [Acidaminococcaceae bacterium]